jgi:hypothetical protein
LKFVVKTNLNYPIMKRMFFLFMLWGYTVLYAQVPQKFNYQAIARDALGAPIANSIIGLKFTISDGVTDLYAETFTSATNTFGLFNLEIGTGFPTLGSFAAIDWTTGSKYLKIEMDVSGGTNYVTMGTSQLISVPYALVADKAINFLPHAYAGNHSGNILDIYNSSAAGTSIAASTLSGYALKGYASTGYAGYFEGKVHLESNSGATTPNLLIRETENTDYTRLRFDNTTPGRLWEIATINNPVATNEYFQVWHTNGNLLSLRGDGNLGVGVSNPTEKLEVAGNLKFTGSLNPGGNSGTPGQVLQSNGTGTPTWVSPGNFGYNHTFGYNASTSVNLVPDVLNFIPGLDSIPVPITSNSKIIFNYSCGNILNINNFLGGTGTLRFDIKLTVGSIYFDVDLATIHCSADNGHQTSVSFTKTYEVTPGLYFFRVSVVPEFGDNDFAISGYDNVCTIQVIPQ